MSWILRGAVEGRILTEMGNLRTGEAILCETVQRASSTDFVVFHGDVRSTSHMC
jgi:hypothetical protein